MTSLDTNLALQLPVIDFTSRGLKPGTLEWDSVRAGVRKALEEYGCFEALFDKVTVDLRKAVFEASEELFRLPLETKQRTVSEIKYKGYVGQNPTNPLYEGVGIDVADNAEKVNGFTQKLWPQGNKSFSETVLLFTEHVSELDFKIRRMIMESFGLEKNYIEEHLKSTKCLMRMMKYRGVDKTEEELGMEAHTDRNMLTILCQNDVKDGLEVKTRDDKHWIKVNPSQDSSFIVLGGATLHVLMNGRVFTGVHRVVRMGTNTRLSAGLFTVPKTEDLVYAPEEMVLMNGRVFTGVHRVVRMGTNTRLSAGLFTVPKTEDLVYAPEEMVDAEHPRLFKPFDFEAYFQFTTEGSGRRDLAALRAYCGL